MNGTLYSLDNGYMLIVDKIVLATCDDGLSKKNCDSIFGVVDVEELADEYSDKKYGGGQSPSYFSGFSDGFNKALELQKDKLFTIEDMRQAYDDGMNNIDADGCIIDIPDEDFIDTLRCIRQRGEIEVEIVTRPYTDVHEGFELETKREYKLDENGYLILKKK